MDESKHLITKLNLLEEEIYDLNSTNGKKFEALNQQKASLLEELEAHKATPYLTLLQQQFIKRIESIQQALQPLGEDMGVTLHQDSMDNDMVFAIMLGELKAAIEEVEDHQPEISFSYGTKEVIDHKKYIDILEKYRQQAHSLTEFTYLDLRKTFEDLFEEMNASIQ